MNRIAGLLLLGLGVAMFARGLRTAPSVGSDLSRIFTGMPGDRSVG